MSTRMLYYLAWEEDDWLDEILDYFRAVNAVVPTRKTLQLMKEQREQGAIDQVILVVNVAHEQEKSEEFLRLVQADETFAHVPLYLVGVEESEEEAWKKVSPHAKVVVIHGSKYEFDYEAVLKQIDADWRE